MPTVNALSVVHSIKGATWELKHQVRLAEWESTAYHSWTKGIRWMMRSEIHVQIEVENDEQIS
jgi:hypothetical protein